MGSCKCKLFSSTAKRLETIEDRNLRSFLKPHPLWLTLHIDLLKPQETDSPDKH